MAFSFIARLTLFLKDTVILMIFLVHKKKKGNCNAIFLFFFGKDIVSLT